MCPGNYTIIYMLDHIKLMRPKDWAKNLFLFIPSFFAGKLFDPVSFKEQFALLVGGFFAFSFLASSIYIVNDYRDIADDRKHPVKKFRPLASGKVSKTAGLVMSLVLVLAGFVISYWLDASYKFLFIAFIYFLLNLAYSFGIKNISIVDILVLASGFVLRVKAGAVLGDIHTTEWLIIMTFLLALFMAIAKRRDDVVLKINTGTEMRRAVKGYSIEFLNTLLGLFCAILIVAYISYTVSGALYHQFGHRLYYTSLFVIAGVMRYLQITMVHNKAGSPTEILYKDRFIQVTLLLWIASFYFILYIKDITLFT